MKNYKYLPVITGLFCSTLLVSNTLDTKLFVLGALTLPCGILLFQLAYIFGDILTEVYGFNISRKVIWTGFASLVMMTLFYRLAIVLEPAPFWKLQESYEKILGQIPRVVTASIIAYFIGEFANSFTLAKLKVKTAGKNMSVRFIVSTIVGQGVDTTVFVIIAFAGILPMSELLVVTLSGWGFKVIWEIIALPITIPIVKWLKKVENEDCFDTNVNFNPFHFRSK